MQELVGSYLYEDEEGCLVACPNFDGKPDIDEGFDELYVASLCFVPFFGFLRDFVVDDIVDTAAR